MKLIGPFTQIITMDHLPLKGGISDGKLEVINDGGVLVNDDKIVEVGFFSDFKKEYPTAEIEGIESGHILLPGFVDAHTHICWAGTRATDFAMRNAGKSYLDISESGGGIWSTVLKTREANQAYLAHGIRERARKMLHKGITTIEVKSGYGLNYPDELKMLRAIREVADEKWVDLVPTCLAAHLKPRDFEKSTSAYLDFILSELLPVVKKERLSNRVDIFTERTAFSVDESWNYLESAKKMGFDITVHADQFTPGGSILAARLGAVSADHLESSGDAEIKALADSNTVAVALPGASIGLGEPFAPMRKLLDRGACVAIASDWNPGSAPIGDLVTAASILATYQKITTAEVFAALTYRAAYSLKLQDRGVLRKSMIADFQAYPTADYRDILYHQGQLSPDLVWKNGKMIS